MTRIAVVDVGSNSTRLLIADIGSGGSIDELVRRSTVTRLAEGVDRTGVLREEAIERVMTVLAGYREAIDEAGATTAIGVLTSAARDAANGAELTEAIRARFAIDARTIDGDEEARLTYLGATSERAGDDGTTLVADIGGGSTELVVGRGADMLIHASTQVGVVRHSERHLPDDPPAATGVAALRADVAATFAAIGHNRRWKDIDTGIAVAGTATSCAAILLEVEPYDSKLVEGFALRRDAVDELLERTSAMTLARRRALPGLHPDRAPTVVAGIAILLEVMTAFGLTEVTVSEHDILRGAALARAHSG